MYIYGEREKERESERERKRESARQALLAVIISGLLVFITTFRFVTCTIYVITIKQFYFHIHLAYNTVKAVAMVQSALSTKFM